MYPNMKLNNQFFVCKSHDHSELSGVFKKSPEKKEIYITVVVQNEQLLTNLYII